MKQEQIVLALIRDSIAQAPAADNAGIKAAEAELRAVLAAHNPVHGEIALALIGAELAAK